MSSDELIHRQLCRSFPIDTHTSEKVTPEAFAARQRLCWTVPGAIASFAYVFALVFLARVMVNLQSMRKSLELLVVVGPLVIGGIFVLWISLSFRYRGLLLARRSPYCVAVTGEELELAAGGRCTSIPLRSIKALTEVTQEAFQEIAGYEDVCLELALQGGSTIIVPGSARGYGHAVELLKTARIVNYRSI